VLPQLDVNGGVWVINDQNNSSNHSLMVAVGTDYFLSKATALYVQLGVVNNHGAMQHGLSVNGATMGALGTTIGADIGVRHLF
jgi:predicted porin